MVCPFCKKAVEMRLFENVDASLVAHLLKKPAEGFAVCPKCAVAFSVNPNYIEQKKLGTVCTLEPHDLSPITPSA